MNKNSVFKKFFSFVWFQTKGYHKFIPIVILISLTMSLLSMSIAYFGKYIIDNLLILNYGSIISISILTISMYVVSLVLNYGSTLLNGWLVNVLKNKMQLDFYDSIQKSDYLFFSRIRSSDIHHRMFNDIRAMLDYFLSILINIPINIITLIVSLFIMIYWSWEIALIILSMAVIQFIIVISFNKITKERALKQLNNDQRLLFYIDEFNRNNEQTRILSLEDRNLKKLDEKFNECKKSNLKYLSITTLSSSIASFILQIGNVMLLILGFVFIGNGKMTMGSLIGFSLISSYIYSALNAIFAKIVSYQITKVSYTRFRDFYDRIDFNRNEGNKKFSFANCISINDISFGYGEDIIIKNFSCSINKGSIVQIKGDNGCGKTTLIKLILRFFSPIQGSIYIDDISINEINYNDYRENVIAVLSNPEILSTSLYDNITLGKEYSDADVNDILNSCKLQNVVNRLPEGINSNIGIETLSLSDGEKQKIALARALIRKPKILILDEPIIHLDLDSVNDIVDTVQEHNKTYDITILFVSHDKRIETIANQYIDLCSKEG